jgi:hypothetical protein
LPVVYACNTDADVAYAVYVVGGKYRAVNLIPGSYEITIRAAVDQLEGFTPESVQRNVAADANVTANLTSRDIRSVKNYVNGLQYETCTANPPSPEIAAEIDFALKHGGIDTGKAIGDCDDPLILPYEEIYPPGLGRDIMERTCLGCHHVQPYSFNAPRTYGGGRAKKGKAAWAVNVDRKITRMGFSLALGRSTHFDPELLPQKDRDILVDYLADNFGVVAPSRLVQLKSEPELDLKALEKAQWVEYIYHEDPEKYPVWP